MNSKRKLRELFQVTTDKRIQELILIILKYDKVLNDIEISLEKGIDPKKIKNYIKGNKLQ